MIAYNVTTKVVWDVVDEWLDWQTEIHIPEIMATGLFDEYKLFRLMDVEDDGATFTAQYFTSNKDRYKKFISDFAPALRQKAVDRWGNQFIAYHSAVEQIV